MKVYLCREYIKLMFWSEKYLVPREQYITYNSILIVLEVIIWRVYFIYNRRKNDILYTNAKIVCFIYNRRNNDILYTNATIVCLIYNRRNIDILYTTVGTIVCFIYNRRNIDILYTTVGTIVYFIQQIVPFW